MKTNVILGAATLALLALAPTAAKAETFNTCRGYIASLPATITQQGTWCLNKDLTTNMASGVAIDIAVNNVILDCNSFKIGGQAAGLGTQTIGIRSKDRLNTTIRHCTVRGFQTGLSVGGDDTSGHLLHDNRVDAATLTGIFIEGSGSVVKNNVVSDTGGGDGVAIGIHAGEGVDLRDNLVDGVLPGGANANGYGIFSYSTGGVVRENRVRNVAANGTGFAFGMYLSGSGLRRVVDNDLFGTGATSSWGVYCAVQDSSSVADNYMGAFGVGYKFCSNDGGNVVR